jgi:TolB protein
MYHDDERLPGFYDPTYDADNELNKRSWGCNCLFIGITLLLIATLVGSSALAYFAVSRQSNRPPISIGDEQADALSVIVGAATAAPATVVAAAPTAAPTATTGSPVFAPPEINRIALINSDGQLETMSPDGEDRRILTLASDETSFLFPAWAPDSRRLAVIGSRTVGGGIYVLDDAARTGSLGAHMIYYSADRTPFYLFWSPDSQNLAFLANHPRNTMGLNVIAGDGTADSRLLATGAPFYWDWSDDGQQLLIHAGGGRADHTLSLIDLEGEAQAINLATPGVFQAPGIGQSGRYWAFAEQAEDGLSALAVVDTQTGERQSYQASGSLALGWSPAGDQIAYTNGAVDGHPFWGPLRLLDVATGETQLLSSQTVLAFFWSPDGRSLAFLTLGRERGDDSINAAAPAKNRITSRVAAARQFGQGQGFLTLSVVDVATGQGLRLLNFNPTLVYLSQFLPYFDQYALSHRVWSPDSQAIVLPVRQDETNQILVVPVDGSLPYELAEGEIAFWSFK